MAVEDLREADLEARVAEAGRPVVLDFYQESCPPCRALEPRLARVSSESSEVRAYRVDIDRDPAVARRFRVMSLPTLLLVKDGREVARRDGLIRDPELRDLFEGAEASLSGGAATAPGRTPSDLLIDRPSQGYDHGSVSTTKAPVELTIAKAACGCGCAEAGCTCGCASDARGAEDESSSSCC